ncbi:MAG: TIM-barrel domain-containing protein [Haloarculaceae archaeon]
MTLHDYHVPAFEPVADEAATVTGPDYRFTVLTPRLIRAEYDPAGEFEDRPTQTMWYREQPVPAFSVDRSGGDVVVETDALTLTYAPEGEHGAASEASDGEGFTADSLSVTLADGTTWRYGEGTTNLGGTNVSLDHVDGATDIDPGLLSRSGVTVVDDGETPVFDGEWVTPRAAPDCEDLYVFGYGDDYRAALRDYTAVAGDVPMLPRWALGNWWCRYWEYSQAELRDLMAEFRERDIPLSVCVVDMDWHATDEDEHGIWLTGFTWDEELFPDPPGFIDALHEAGLRVSLNVHPADGVHPHESQYEAFAAAMDRDPEAAEPIPFDPEDTDFLRNYFDLLLHPKEERDGVDFWWMDDYPTRFEHSHAAGAAIRSEGGPVNDEEHAAGDPAPIEGVDAHWALNHLHALDRARDGRRPFLLTRYRGLGDHRNMTGFSGDTVISWDSLAFQPGFTASASNVEYGWWSHDLGGHFGGTGDPEAFGELYARWLQFGAVSPVTRMHGVKDQFVDKRPWEFPDDVSGALIEALRLRHELIPYLYTLVRENHVDAVPPTRPLYYEHPDTEAAYHVPHEYRLGSELLVAPHLEPRGDATGRSRRSVWLPEGEWFDVFSGARYDAGWHARHGGLADLPVYAPAGAILPRGPRVGWGGVENPETLRVLAFPGADNAFELYEDGGVGQDYRDGAYATTAITQSWEGDALELAVAPADGDHGVLPEERTFEFSVRGVARPAGATLTVDGESHTVSLAYDAETETATVTAPAVAPDESVTLTLRADGASLLATRDRTRERLTALLDDFVAPTTAKNEVLDRFDKGVEGVAWLGEFAAALEDAQLRALLETVHDVGWDVIDADGTERLAVWNGTDARVDYRVAAWRAHSPTEGESDVRRGTVSGDEVVSLAAFADADRELQVTVGDVLTATGRRDAGE